MAMMEPGLIVTIGTAPPSPHFFALDFETLGVNPHRHAICQIGIAFSQRIHFCSDVGGSPADWSRREPQAIEVNHWDEERFINGPALDYVEGIIIGIMMSATDSQHEWIPVGWNVGSFDALFAEVQMPRFRSHWRHRSVDLNALCYGLHGVNGMAYDEWKEMAKRAAMDELGSAVQWHDAGYDARSAMISFRFLRDAMSKK